MDYEKDNKNTQTITLEKEKQSVGTQIDTEPTVHTFPSINLFSSDSLTKKQQKEVVTSDNKDEKLEKLNTFLWQAGKSSDFLPHSLITDKDITDKLLLSDKLENKYNQEYLLLSTFVDDMDFLKSFEKIFYIFKKDNLEEAKKIANFLKDFPLQINLKAEGKWVVVDSLDNIN